MKKYATEILHTYGVEMHAKLAAINTFEFGIGQRARKTRFKLKKTRTNVDLTTP